MSTPPTPSTPTAAAATTASTAASPSGTSVPPASPADASAPTSSSTPATHEERLLRTWRGIQTSAIQMMSKAEKSAQLMQQEQQQKQPSRKQPNATLEANPALKESFRDVDESVVQFLRTRIEFHRLLSHVEAKLQGKAEEMESLETYLKTEPKVGEDNVKKRKLDDLGEEAQTQQDVTGA